PWNSGFCALLIANQTLDEAETAMRHDATIFAVQEQISDAERWLDRGIRAGNILCKERKASLLTFYRTEYADLYPRYRSLYFRVTPEAGFRMMNETWEQLKATAFQTYAGRAARVLGYCWLYGIGTTRSADRARRFYEESISKGDKAGYAGLLDVALD